MGLPWGCGNLLWTRAQIPGKAKGRSAEWLQALAWQQKLSVQIQFGRGHKFRVKQKARSAEWLQALAWWAFRDSNPGPTGYEPVALTN